MRINQKAPECNPAVTARPGRFSFRHRFFGMRCIFWLFQTPKQKRNGSNQHQGSQNEHAFAPSE